jgi:UDP-GlcNAc:undecaprenyl-phosphate GlcNAc-1-phosphate transferase
MFDMVLSALLFAGAGLAVALVLVPLARHLSAATGLMAEPSQDRWHHGHIGTLGGVAMGLTLLLVLPWTGAARPFWPLLLCTALMWLLGLADDVRSMRPVSKLLGQVLVSALLLYLTPPLSLTGQVLVDYGIAFIWLVGLTNAFNLLDNIDGLAAGVGAIAAGFLALTIGQSGVSTMVPLALALWVGTGMALGFLRYNFQPASIFMGDSGSHLLGFFISGAALVALPSLDSRSFWPAIVGPVITLLIPIFDTAFVSITRGLSGRGVFQGGRDHTSHRLVALGISERRAVLVLYGLAVIGGLIGLVFHAEPRYAWGLAVLFGAALGALGLYLGHLDSTHQADGTAPRTLLPGELTTRYRAYEVCLDALIIGVAYYLAFGIRFAEPEFSKFLPYFTRSLPLVLALQLGGLALSGKYHQVWRGFGAAEAASLIRGVGMGMTATLIAVLYIYRFEGFSRAVFLFDATLLTAFLIAARAGLSSVDDYLRRQRGGRVALIIGAGRGGALAARELEHNAALGLMPCGFLDDDPAKRRLRIDGYRVLGDLASLPQVLDRYAVSEVIVAIRDLAPSQLDAIWAACDARQIPVRRMRLALEETDWRDRTPGVVRFPER